MYECESWTIKKAGRQRIDAFELWCWRRLLRVPWTARSSNQSILKEISPEYSSEGLMLKPKLQFTLATWFEELTHWKRPWCWERLKAGGEGDDRGEMVGRHHRLDGHEFEQDLGIGEGQGGLVSCSPWGRRGGHDWVTELNWSTLWALLPSLHVRTSPSAFGCSSPPNLRESPDAVSFEQPFLIFQWKPAPSVSTASVPTSFLAPVGLYYNHISKHLLPAPNDYKPFKDRGWLSFSSYPSLVLVHILGTDGKVNQIFEVSRNQSSHNTVPII